jgi:hypothetical protein
MPDVVGKRLKVVAHGLDGSLIKGYIDEVPKLQTHSLDKPRPVSLPGQLALFHPDSGEQTSIDLRTLKALFFVKTFEGSKEYAEVKFFKAHPLVEGLWVRVKFADGESTEGVVYNSIDFVVNPGFFIKPPDPQSNNRIVYVTKKSFVEFRVLGVKGSY